MLLNIINAKKEAIATNPLAGISVDLLGDKSCDCCCRLCDLHLHEFLCVV